jgi:uncharacterized membrane protein (Fun14 family)
MWARMGLGSDGMGWDEMGWDDGWREVVSHHVCKIKRVKMNDEKPTKTSPNDSVHSSILNSTDPVGPQEIGFATILGASAGFATKKVIKTGGVVLGLGFISLQLLARADLIKVNWEKIEKSVVGKIDQDGDGKLTHNDIKVGALKLIHNISTDLPSTAGFAAAFFLGFRYG